MLYRPESPSFIRSVRTSVTECGMDSSSCTPLLRAEQEWLESGAINISPLTV